MQSRRIVGLQRETERRCRTLKAQIAVSAGRNGNANGNDFRNESRSRTDDLTVAAAVPLLGAQVIAEYERVLLEAIQIETTPASRQQRV
jgi:hypothetical protein